MKNPLIVLLICAITTFTMGWFGHRVFSKSRAKTLQQQQEQIVPEQTKKADTPKISAPDTMVAKKADTNVVKPIEETNPAAPPIILASAVNDTLWNDDKEVIIKSPDGSVEIKRKFKTSKSFKDFPAEKLTIKGSKPLDFSTSKYGKLYKTATKKSADKGINFGGRYSFVSIECGEGCFSSTIVDMKTGKVYDGPHASGGYLFKSSSRLLIVNPPQPDGFYEPCELCEPILYVWSGKEFKKLK